MPLCNRAAARDPGDFVVLEQGRPLPVPLEEAQSPDADLIELAPLAVHAGSIAR
jgi:hypothetical protein